MSTPPSPASDRDDATLDADNWPEQDAPADNRGLPGYPPHKERTQVESELGFDPDSPDLADPQIDPPHPPRIPDDAPDPRSARRAPSDQYPPYEKP
ncbi:MAG: DUF6021 family protein [Pseudomonas sp.]